MHHLDTHILSKRLRQSAVIQRNSETRLARFRMQNSACPTTFLSAMLIGLNVVSSSCISKQIGRKFTSFLRWHFLSTPWFLHQLKTCRVYLVYMSTEVLGSKVWWKYYCWGRQKLLKHAEKDSSATIVASIRLAGVTIVGSINMTANTASLIFTIAQSQNGFCQMILL